MAKKPAKKNTVFHAMRSELPGDSSRRHRIARRLIVLALCILCAGTGLWCLYDFNSPAVISCMGVAVILLIYFVTDLATGGTRVARIVTAIDIVPIFAAIILSRTGGVVSLMWAAMIPAFSMLVCGIVYGLIDSLLFLLFISILFYTPMSAYIPNIYPYEAMRAFPVVYVLIGGIMFAICYNRHEKAVSAYENKRELEKQMENAEETANELVRQTIMSIISAVDAKDNYTRDHSVRVAQYSAMLAAKLGWDEKRIEALYQSALLHDIGKIGIRDDVLKKRGSLTNEEYEEIKTHTLIGESILKDLKKLPWASVGAACHHERYDGKGYPRGLTGTWIPLEGRIIGIADAFDAMNGPRIYRDPMKPEIIMRELRRGAGTQFDPKLIEVFLPIAEQIIEETHKE